MTMTTKPAGLTVNAVTVVAKLTSLVASVVTQD